MNDLKPWPLLMVIGGLVVAGSTFLDWSEIILIDGSSLGETGWDKGLLGLYQLIIGVTVAIIGLAQLGPKSFPARIATLSINQWMLALSVAVVIWGFGLQFDTNPEIGVFTSWVGGVVAAVGSVMTERTQQGDL